MDHIDIEIVVTSQDRARADFVFELCFFDGWLLYLGLLLDFWLCVGPQTGKKKRRATSNEQ